MKIIPEPLNIERNEGYFDIPEKITISYSNGKELLPFFAAEITKLCGISTYTSKEKNCTIIFEKSVKDELPAESYKLTINKKKIIIETSEESGFFYASRTLLQLLMEYNAPQVREKQIPCVNIEDKPAYTWRGAMIDSSRHMQSVDELKKFIDLMALHKLNTLQWHLTDDQGWRIEIKKYPKLTSIGGFRKGTIKYHLNSNANNIDKKEYGGFYTQAQIRDLVTYAAARFITIVPEIDMPGHMQAAIAAYPEIGCVGKEIESATSWGVKNYLLNPTEKTITFIENIFTEILALFPAEYIHIGGDEAVKTQWRDNLEVQEQIKTLGLKSEEDLQAWFLGRIEDYLTKNSRRMVGWDEILDGQIRESTAVMSWRSNEGAIIGSKRGHQVIIADLNGNYLDSYQHDPKTEPLAIGGLLTCEKTYKYNVIPRELNPKDITKILGLQGQLWTEYMPDFSTLEYMAFPRLCALAENSWLPEEKKDWKRFKSSWSVHCRRLDIYGVNYFQGSLEMD